MKRGQKSMNKKFTIKDFIAPIVAAVVTLVFCILVFVVDVATIGPENTSVGFAALNGAFSQQFGFNETLYDISDYLGYLSILGVGIFACLGLYQLIKNKGLAGVDKEILLLGGLFVLIFALYVGFDKLALNFRPVILPGETSPEASFPSSHTLMSCVVMGAIAMVLPKYIKNKKLSVALRVLCILILAATVFCRLFSGVHWVTDIVASLLISMTLLMFFRTLLLNLRSK